MTDGRRRTFPKWLKAGALVATVVWPAAGPTAAQEATSAAQPPAECRVAPRPPEELAAIVAVASPVAEFRSVDAADDLPRGEPADAETAAAIADAAGEYAACLNAADYPRLLALMTERSIGGVVEQWGAWTTSSPGRGRRPPTRADRR